MNRRVFLILSKSPSADVNAWDSPKLEVRIEWEDFVSAAAGAIHFDPDPDTNMATLLTAGHFEMTGPGALNVSFDASIGTSPDQLALLLASGLNLAGYNPQVSGEIVKFFPLSRGWSLSWLRATALNMPHPGICLVPTAANTGRHLDKRISLSG